MTESPQPVENAFHRCWGHWKTIPANPVELLILSDRVAAAFGHGATLLTGDNQLIELIREKAVNKRVMIAGVDFSLDNLDIIGKFYNLLSKKGFKGVCMDERIDRNAPHQAAGIHHHCGAADAIGQLVGINGEQIEDMAASLLGKGDKAELIPEMEEAHETLAIKIDLGDSFDVKPEKYKDLKDNGALPIHISLPLSSIAELSNMLQINENTILQSLLKWNLMIAINIIEGPHNAYHNSAKNQGFFIILDNRGLQGNNKYLSTNLHQYLHNRVSCDHRFKIIEIKDNI